MTNYCKFLWLKTIYNLLHFHRTEVWYGSYCVKSKFWWGAFLSGGPRGEFIFSFSPASKDYLAFLVYSLFLHINIQHCKIMSFSRWHLSSSNFLFFHFWGFLRLPCNHLDNPSYSKVIWLALLIPSANKILLCYVKWLIDMFWGLGYVHLWGAIVSACYKC